MAGPNLTTTQTVTIGAGASLSGASTKISGFRLVGIILPAGWDAASLTFQVSKDGTTFVNLYDQFGEYAVASITAGAGIALDVATFFPWDYVKVRSGTAASAVNQVDAVVLTLVFAMLG